MMKPEYLAFSFRSKMAFSEHSGQRLEQDPRLRSIALSNSTTVWAMLTDSGA